jgi:hypothetical protein
MELPGQISTEINMLMCQIDTDRELLMPACVAFPDTSGANGAGKYSCRDPRAFGLRGAATRTPAHGDDP